MMRPYYYTQSASGVSNPIKLDWRASLFTASVGTTLAVDTTATYSIEYTLDPVDTNNPDYVSPPTWVEFTEATDETTAVNFSIISPVIAIRLNVSSYTDGEIRLQIVTAG